MHSKRQGAGGAQGSDGSGRAVRPRADVCHVTIRPGCSIGDHPHVHETEFYYILKGEGVFNDNGKEVVVHAGDICATGYGEVHGMENRSDEVLEMIALIVME